MEASSVSVSMGEMQALQFRLLFISFRPFIVEAIDKPVD